ncbi:addiction module antitoxin [alpha proteobacterium AAP81b]|nr:addiction module antitoxin [alpha proteobacterium AAP81b]
MTIKTKPFDAAKHFASDADQIDLITDAFQTGHPGYIAAAIGTVAKARGMTDIAAETGLNRQSLYAALRDGGNPTLDTILKVFQALGLELTVKSKDLETA